MNTMEKHTLAPLLLAAALLGGCGGFSVGSLWPFDSTPEERSRVPVNATAYQCEGGKRLYVRYMEQGAYAWIILPEREFRLDRDKAGPGTRYGNDKARLEVKGDEVTLSDGPKVSYTGCKVPKPAAEPKEKGEKKS